MMSSYAFFSTSVWKSPRRSSMTSLGRSKTSSLTTRYKNSFAAYTRFVLKIPMNSSSVEKFLSSFTIGVPVRHHLTSASIWQISLYDLVLLFRIR
ncbi:hypothetical protein FR483_n281R [Paramecium bursaria Chlorella virus FR483]|uniref:Uncharacterized protein n281R n=1 Tax=Paramecium bursaria Chlorella virus FR483 TaxID=399781 RepID=A7J6Y5_PBCVF|nr:hypothetical protein FR483_n281R [Paramecium bursaria Chlorella virus FR483]ABT15566.1 hypothetical protein FR483_n281R [Paramecium bursaria Chlorella virus FR483]